MPGIRIGLIGYGSWTKDAIIPALNRDGRAEIISAAAPSPDTRDYITKIYGLDIHVFQGIQELLAGPEVDGIMIAVPDQMHEETLSVALESGIHVFYEPPISDTRKNLIPMLKKLLAAEQITFADLELGLIPAVDCASELVRKKIFGKVEMAEIYLRSGWGPVSNYDLCNFNHLCTWYVDVLNRILNNEPKRVLLMDGTGTPGRRQNQSVGYLDYDGVWGSLRSNISSVGPLEIKIEINGEDGDLLIDLLTGQIKYRSKKEPDWKSESYPAILPYADWPGMHESVAAFLDAVEIGYSTINNAKKVAKLQMVGIAAEESKDSGSWEEVQDISVLLP